VLEANPVHVKALYRRGMSYMLLGDFDDAKKDFEKVCFPHTLVPAYFLFLCVMDDCLTST
jgi:hypothetical protein